MIKNKMRIDYESNLSWHKDLIKEINDFFTHKSKGVDECKSINYRIWFFFDKIYFFGKKLDRGGLKWQRMEKSGNNCMVKRR